jgi:hypothetical protein
MQALVLGHCVVVARPGAGNEFDFITHISILQRLNALAVGTHVSENFLNAVLVDDSEALMRNTKAYKTLLGFDPKALVLQVRQEAATSFIMCVRNIIA